MIDLASVMLGVIIMEVESPPPPTLFPLSYQKIAGPERVEDNPI